MKKHVLVILILISNLASGCATSGGDMIKESVAPNCVLVARVSSMGAHLMPPVASSLAKSMLVKKSKEMGANAVVVQKKSGTIEVEMDGLAYRCP